MKKINALILICFFYFSINAQEQLGLRLENYQPTHSLMLNPAYNLSSPFKWDVNLVAAGQFFQNNYAFISNANVFKLLNNPTDVQFIGYVRGNENQLPAGTMVLDFYKNKNKYYATTSNFVTGPSATLNIGAHNFGIFTNARFMMSAKNLPSDIGYYTMIENLKNTYFKIPKMDAAGMGWTEIGAHYGYRLNADEENWLGLGVNVKYLQGYQAIWAANESDFEMKRTARDTAVLKSPNIRFGFTNDIANNPDNTSINRNGTGLGLDLGLVYVMGADGEHYKAKVGVSLMDFGKIKFTKNTENHQLSNTGEVTLTDEDYSGFNTLDDYLNRLSFDFLGNAQASKISEGFSIALPKTLSLQLDYGVNEKIYVNALLIQSLGNNTASPTVARGDLFAVTPRFQHRWFSASLPLSMYNWSKFNMGFAARLAFLTLGTDNMLGTFSQGNYTGHDFYIALNINPFNINGGGGEKRGGKRGKDVRCYKF